MEENYKKYLELLSEKYPTTQSVCTEIINLNAILNLPKGTEHFMSDIHGEYEAFVHIMNNCSGEIHDKVDMIFRHTLTKQQRKEICTLIYYPKEKMEQMRTEFMGNVSHELKTPIALIQGYAEGLKEGVNDDPESRDFYCDVIMDEAGKMNRMVKNLMTLNQLEFGNDKVEFERFNLTELIGGVLQSMDILSQQKDVKLIFREENPVYVWGDEFKIEQVVRNYVSNAYNHVNEEKIIEVKILREDGLAKVTVFNTGKPIPEEDVPRIWDKFFKVDKAHTREYGGNGIGLSIVKAIMESMHQQYGVKNYDNGVEFWFTLDVR